MGLGLQVTPTGARSWSLRVVIAGKRRELGLGGFPTVQIAVARDKARQARKRHSMGVPEAELRQQRRHRLFGAGSRMACALLLLAEFAGVAGCASTIFSADAVPDQIAVADAPRFEPLPATATRPRIALVLSGGAARGFAHLGVLRVLEREGLRPDLVVGTSAGAIVGALYASGRSVADVELVLARMDWPTLIDIDPVKMVLSGFGLGLLRGDRLEAFMRQAVPVRLQDLPVPFAAVATDLGTGEAVLLNHGDTARAARASSAVPGLYEPVRAGERLLGDGQLVSPLPVSAARLLGATTVVAIDVVYPPQHASLSNPVSILFQAMAISTWHHLLRERSKADLLLQPSIPPSNNLTLADRQWLIAAGELAAEKRLPELREAFARP